MELVDISEWARDANSPPMTAALQAGGTVRCVVVPRGAEFSRKRIDDLTEYAKSLGAGGLLWAKFTGEMPASFKKTAPEGSLDLLRDIVKGKDGDMALIVAGKTTKVWDVLANLRVRVAKDEKLIPDEQWNFVWVVDFPLFEWDDESSRFFARHHPFTSPRLEDLERLESDPGSVLARAYDLALNGIELGGGSIRINQPEVQRRMFRALGISDEDAQARFGFLIDAFRYGAPPHGGIAFGIDRIVMMMARAESLRDVIAFPKTARAQDLMCAAPSEVDAQQLHELGIAISPRS
jgi:aspartyl-tRNA synthetase